MERNISKNHGTKSVYVQEYELGVASAIADGRGQMRVSVDCVVVNICDSDKMGMRYG